MYGKDPEKERQNKRTREQKKVDMSYIDCFTTPQGEDVLADLKRFVGYDEVLHSDNPHDCARNEGARNVVAFINRRMSRTLREVENE